jgi:hypothetical protein
MRGFVLTSTLTERFIFFWIRTIFLNAIESHGDSEIL